jgi:hypothetical protein
MVGTPSAAAICFGPLLLPMKMEHALNNVVRSLSGTRPAADTTALGLMTFCATSAATALSSCPAPINTMLTPARSVRRFTSDE